MGYTMLNEKNIRKRVNDHTLKGEALSFIRNSCEGLRFDKGKISKLDYDTIDYDSLKLDGTSLKPNQIPYNMERDIDRLCLENAIDRFLKSGKKEDAFDVYFCYLEMFVGDYKKTRRMIELLSEYEAVGSGLLMKHRDHYSHSVYVFCLGLAIYESNEDYRNTYSGFYGIEEKYESACHFLKYWGLASLFHDIGYPFELPFEQVCSYFEVDGDDRAKRPYVAYHGLDNYIRLNKSLQRKIGKLFNLGTDKILSTTEEVFAYALSKRLGKTYYFSEAEMLDFLHTKPTEPNRYNHFMDHAYFSATVLFKKLFEELKADLEEAHIDSMTAIILHNSLYKFCVAYYKDSDANIPFEAKLHPLAYMLMLCDELQCWDRTAYGRNSKLELHPMDCRFDFSDNGIKATYIFDEEEKGKIESYKKDKSKDKSLKAYSSFLHVYDEKLGKTVNKFLDDINKIVNLKENIRLSVDTAVKGNERRSNGQSVETSEENKKGLNTTYLSDSNFINLHNFAIILHGRWGAIEDWKTARAEERIEEYIKDEKVGELFEDSFKTLSLEYKLSNINQAKAFAKYLGAIGCFYTDKPADFRIVKDFSEKDLEKIGPMEHYRWLRERYDMGWTYGEKDKKEREVFRQHHLLIKDNEVVSRCFKASTPEEKQDNKKVPEEVQRHYEDLPSEEQGKDKDPMICMLDLLKIYDGLRIYSLISDDPSEA